MAKNWTIKQYHEMIDNVFDWKLYKIIQVKDYPEYDVKSSGPFLVIRHDVDRRPINAFRMAEAEAQRGIRSTYYFRYPFDPEVVDCLDFMGHEIGYHYEVIDKAKGDTRKATKIFRKELEELRRFAKVTTCSPHNNPLTRWDNYSFWKYSCAFNFDIVIDARSIVAGFYVTDTGRGLQMCNLNDNILIDRSMNLCWNIHPERWNDGLSWYRQWAFDLMCNFAKRFIQFKGVHYAKI